MDSDTEISRKKLVAAILARPEPIVLVEAPAGMGKSVLLRQIAAEIGVPVHAAGSPPLMHGERNLLVWDIPPNVACHGLPEIFVEGRRRLVVAVRTGQRIPGLHRARAYGRIHEIDWSGMVFGASELVPHVGRAAARRIVEATGGWPVLAARYLAGVPADAELAGFLGEEVLAALSAEDFVILEDLATGRPVSKTDAASVAPFLRRGGEGVPELLPALAAALAVGDDRMMVWRGDDQDAADFLADAYSRRGQTTRAITLLQRAGRYEQALDIFIRFKGFYYIHLFGSEAFDAVLAGFPESFWREHETLVMALSMQAAKRGDVARARRLLNDMVGPGGANPATMLANRRLYTPNLRLFRLLLAIYEDVSFTEAVVKQAFTLLEELPAAAHLERGSFYNAILEFYIRSRRIDEAEDVAERAHMHYAEAHVPILSFYIALHRAIMRLTSGDVVKSGRFAADAETYLQAAGYDSPGDARLLALLKACIAFENGQAGALIAFIDTEFEQFSHGEIWPTILEFALQYGTQALAEQFSPVAAAAFLERWRVQQMQSRQFEAMVEILKITNLQNASRWQEASDRLSGLDFRADRSFVLHATAELTRLEDRDEIAAAMAWLRHLTFDNPTQPGLMVQLQAMLDNMRLSGRQRTALRVWQSFAHKRARNLTRARALLLKTLEDAAQMGALAPLAGERVFLGELLEDQRIAQFLSASNPARQVLRRLSLLGVSASAAGGVAGLTRRETKVLMMIAEGASNKFIAHALGLSEATVKFHLSNLYRKLDCSRRREAILAARSLGLLS